MRSVLVIVAVLAATALAQRCAMQCYRGTVSFADAPTLDYAFSVVPCGAAGPQVVAASLGDAGDALAMPTFACAAADGAVTLTLEHAGGAHLEWRYTTADSCDTVLASLATMPATFAGTAHRATPTGGDTVVDGAPLADVQIECLPATCAPMCFDSGIIVLAGVAGDKSPCGAAGADACPVRVQYTLSMCDSPPRVLDFDVLVGGDAVRLANYQPAAVGGAQLSCDDASAGGAALHLDTAGVALAWASPADNAADCASLLTRPDLLATGALRSAIVQVESLWAADGLRLQSVAASAALCDALPTDMPGATDGATPEPSDEPADEPSDEPQASAAPAGSHAPAPAPATAPSVATPRAIVPHVHCSERRNGRCCSLFGYTNPNLAPVELPAGRPHNFLVPGGALPFGSLVFAPNATVDTAFAVSWSCPEYERHTLRWVLQTEAPHGRWRRMADAARTRDDCSDAEYNTWCT